MAATSTFADVAIATTEGTSRIHVNQPGPVSSVATGCVRRAIRHSFGDAAVKAASSLMLVSAIGNREANRQALLGAISDYEPDIIHALRIPYEGMIAAAAAPAGIPLVASVWGNDLTLWAMRSPFHSRATRAVIERVDGLVADCKRDLDLALAWGWSLRRPTLLAPGNGGVDTSVFRPGPGVVGQSAEGTEPIVVNPRGLRPYVCTQTFLTTVKILISAEPKLEYIWAGVGGSERAYRLLRRAGLDGHVRTTTARDAPAMARLFQEAVASVSLTSHDGTPNTLLEAMACGAIPIAGNLGSIREWIVDGRNGCLVDPSDAPATALAIRRAVHDAAFREEAAALNLQLVRERASREKVIPEIAAHYNSVLTGRQRGYDNVA